jgi:hypothetical protein
MIGFVPAWVQAGNEEWAFLPGTPLFRPLIADPREPQTKIIAYTSQTRFEGSVGAAFELLRYSPADESKWGWGLFGSGVILLDEQGATFPMQDGDWQAGMYISETSGSFSHRLEFVHQSSHLGDALQGIRQPIFYSRENFNYVLSFRPCETLRLNAGAGFWENIYPVDKIFFASIGTEIYSPEIPFANSFLGAYATGHLRWKEEAGGTLNQTYQLGCRWRIGKDASKAVRLALVYVNGLSEFGQFYLQKDEHWGIGIYFDP